MNKYYDHSRAVQGRVDPEILAYYPGGIVGLRVEYCRANHPEQSLICTIPKDVPHTHHVAHLGNGSVCCPPWPNRDCVHEDLRVSEGL